MLKRKASTELPRHSATTTKTNTHAKQLLTERPPQTLLTVLEADTHLYHIICQHLPIPSIIAWSRTCSAFRNAYLQRWSVDNRLKRFVKSPTRLRSMLAKPDALVAGSFALQFFAQCLWPESGLDIFVKQGTGAQSFYSYLLEEEDYRLDTLQDINRRTTYFNI